MSVDSVQHRRNQNWDKNATAYQQYWQNPSLEGSLYKQLEGDLLIEVTSANQGKAILDLCSGTGRNTISLARTGARVYGVDGAPSMVEQARANATDAGLTNVTFQLGDSRSLNFPDNMFDAVVGTRFMYMMNAAEKRQILAEIHRVLKPDGITAIQFNCGLWGVKHELLNCLRARRPRLKSRYLWPGQASKLFPGFRIDAVIGTKIPRLGLITRITGKRGLALNRMMRLPLLGHLSAYAIVVATCQKQ